MNAIDIIIHYKQLLDQGLISRADFEAKKAEALATGTDNGDTIELLKRYKALLDWNVITPYEFEQKRNQLFAKQSKGAKKKKKAIIAAAIGVPLIVVLVLAAVLLPPMLKYRKLPAGMKMGEPFSTSISKASKIEASKAEQEGIQYVISNGKVYGYRFNRLYMISDAKNCLDFVSIYFDDPMLDKNQLVKEVTKSFGQFDRIDDNEDYWWNAKTISVCVGELSGRPFLMFFSK